MYWAPAIYGHCVWCCGGPTKAVKVMVPCTWMPDNLVKELKHSIRKEFNLSKQYINKCKIPWCRSKTLHFLSLSRFSELYAIVSCISFQHFDLICKVCIFSYPLTFLVSKRYYWFDSLMWWKRYTGKECPASTSLLSNISFFHVYKANA